MNKLKGRSVTQTESVDVSAREDKGVDIKVDRRGLLKYSDPVMDEKDFEQLSSDYQLNDKKSEASTAAPAAEVDVDAGVGEVKTEKSPQSALGKELKSLMRLNGPMTVAEFMLQCSGAPNKVYRPHIAHGHSST